MAIKMNETGVQNEIRMEISKSSARVFRNNVGFVKHADGSMFPYGLGTGTSDLVGWYPLTITPDMVGQRVAIFLAVEVKKENHKTQAKRLQQQMHFLQQVVESGGIGVLCDDPMKVESLMKRSLIEKVVAK
jgi:hypothetical protein